MEILRSNEATWRRPSQQPDLRAGRLPTRLMEETPRETPRRPNPTQLAMFDPVVPPPPQLYLRTYVTDKQERLNGSNTRRLRVPANAFIRECPSSASTPTRIASRKILMGRWI
jgi:hypothetical protein